MKTEEDFINEQVKKELAELNERREKNKHLDRFEDTKKNREALASYIYDCTKDVYNYKMGTSHLMTMPMDELIKESEDIEEAVVRSIADDNGAKLFHEYELKEAESNPNATIIDNPEFESYPIEYPGHYKKEVMYTPEIKVKNAMQEALDNAKPEKKKKKRKNGFKM
jgi:hypothetical protein